MVLRPIPRIPEFNDILLKFFYVHSRCRSSMLTHFCSYELTHGMRNSFVCDEEEGIAG
jgi:hypothetical protein